MFPSTGVGGLAAWDLTTGNKNVVLLDLDTGIDYNNPDLAPNVWTAPAAYTITEGGNVYNCPQGSHGFNAVDNQSGCAGQEYDNGGTYGHGTFMAGIMGAATNNGLGIAGTDWNASILSVTICTSVCDVATAITGIDAALQIAQRFQLSLAAANFSHTVDDGGGALVHEMALATTRTGVVFAVSTGDDCGGPGEPASEHAPDVIAVAASDMSDNRAYWSGGNCSDSGGDIAARGPMSTRPSSATTAATRPR